MKDIREAVDIAGKRVLVRIDANAPLKDGGVINAFRIKALIPTIQFLIDARAKVILIGHVGRDHESMEPIYREFAKKIELTFIPEILGEAVVGHISEMKDGDVVLLENLRHDEREEGNDEAFTQALASLADIYVNEAFAVSHRKHASLVGVPKLLPSFAGIQLQKEVEMLSRARKPKSPSLFILGGAKFDTKLPLVEAFCEVYDTVFVGGALANDFFNARGLEVGESRLSDVDITPILHKENILTPSDVVVSFGNDSNIKKPEDIERGERITDAGPETVALLKEKISTAESILWNGTLGEYEHGFGEATNELIELIAERTKSDGVQSIVGGGDTSASIANRNLEQAFTFLSTGGGAMLQFLRDGTLPAIEALE